jgi:hypothetical protein
MSTAPTVLAAPAATDVALSAAAAAVAATPPADMYVAFEGFQSQENLALSVWESGASVHCRSRSLYPFPRQ